MPETEYEPHPFLQLALRDVAHDMHPAFVERFMQRLSLERAKLFLGADKRH